MGVGKEGGGAGQFLSGGVKAGFIGVKWEVDRGEDLRPGDDLNGLLPGI